MKNIITLAIIVVVFSSTINAVEADIVAGDEFELFFPITNDNNYLATYEFYLVVNPDAEGFNITISPMSLELNPDETVNVTILVTTPLHAAGGFYEFILYYTYSGQESGGGEPSHGSGSSHNYNWNPPEPPYVPSEEEDTTPEIPDDVPNVIYVPGPSKTGYGNLGILFLLLIIFVIAIMLFVLYKKKKSE